jgi:glycosyltransferase involved in cell wall biosynthesis
MPYGWLMPRLRLQAATRTDNGPLRVVCAHLLDDLSGSAKVLRQVIGELEADGALVRVTVGSAGDPGFIRSSHATRQVFYWVSRGGRMRQLLSFAIGQGGLFIAVVDSCLRWHADVVYANTVMTPGATLAAWLCGRTAIVHLHESGLGSRALFAGLMRIADIFSDKMICVSDYTREALQLPAHRSTVVYNSLPRNEWLAAHTIATNRRYDVAAPFVVLMACTLVAHKGIDSFLSLASIVRQRCGGEKRVVLFRLLLNTTDEAWAEFASQHEIPDNVTVVLRSRDVYVQYRDASLVLNLTHKDLWVETFGMTLLEAMSCGVPVVGPMIGGCTELFEHGRGGWRIDSRDIEAIERLIVELATDPRRWAEAGNAARANAERFHPDHFSGRIRAAVRGAVVHAWPANRTALAVQSPRDGLGTASCESRRELGNG